MIKRIFPLFSLSVIIILVAISCGAEKKLAKIEAAKPDWAKTKPVSSSYYIGVGSAPKTVNVNDYKQNAKQNALTDMAGEISIKVSNTSVLNKLESDYSYGESYVSKTQTAVADDLEGYEPVDSYEDEYNYYVYYRLSKSLYAKLKQEKIDKAVENAKTKYAEAENYIAKHNYKDALTYLIRAFDDIKPHMGESLETELNGEKVYFGNELINKIQVTLNELKINPAQNQIITKRGFKITKEQLTFTLKDKTGSAVSKMPLKAEFSAQVIYDDKFTTDDKGQVKYYVNKVKTKTKNGTFNVKLDINELLKYASTDPKIRRIVRQFSVPKVTVQVEIKAPTFYVTSLERNLNQALTVPYLEEAFISKLTAEDFSIVTNKSEADFLIYVEANTSKGEHVSKMYSSLLNVKVKVKSPENELLYQNSFAGVKGTDLSYESAGLKAYKEGVQQLYLRIYSDMISKLIK